MKKVLQLRDFLDKILQFDPQMRLHIKQSFEHPFCVFFCLHRVQFYEYIYVYLFMNLPLTVLTLFQAISQTEPRFGFVFQLYQLLLEYSATMSLPFVVLLSCTSNERRQSVSPVFAVKTNH